MTNLNQIALKVNRCKECPLYKKRLNAVPGVGLKNAKIMIIGEAPGKKEDEKGEPFVGQAGKLLDELLKSIGFEKKDVFITNIVKCRPPDNRDPKKNEINKCIQYLYEQIKIIKPKIIITLGRHSMNTFFPKLKISEEHGKLKILKEIKIDAQNFFIMYHPAFALYNASKKDILKKDIKKIPKILKKIYVKVN